MSSGFVSGGTTDTSLDRSDEWLAVQEQLEANRRRKAEESRQSNGRSLYEVLEANRAAKQEAFEEANKLKNQFRALDEDEVEFLDSVLESTRREEERVRRETAEGLVTFRQRQEEADKKLLLSQQGHAASPADEDEEEWAASGAVRKRKRKGGREKEGLRGVKLRRSSTAAGENQPLIGEISEPGVIGSPNSQKPVMDTAAMGTEPGAAAKQDLRAQAIPAASPPQATIGVNPTAKGGLELVDYGSDWDED